MKSIYLVRHCEAEGQPPDAPLTVNGRRQALELREFFSSRKVDRIVSSPYTRALASIEPTAAMLKIEVEKNALLAERTLSTKDMPDWLEKLELTFHDLEVKFDGGESSKEATNRIISVIDELVQGESETSIVVTHGNLMALLLNHLTGSFGFEDWKSLSNPDVYVIRVGKHQVTCESVWER